MEQTTPSKPGLLVLASTYPRWTNDHEPGFVHELSKRLTKDFRVFVVTPHAPGAAAHETVDGVEVVRYRYAPQRFETLVHGGGIAANLAGAKWKTLLLPTFLFSQLLAARRVLSNSGIEVVHAHWLLPQGVIALILKIISGTPYVVTSHGGDLFGLRGRISRWMKRQVARRASAMTVVSSAMREEAVGAGLKPPTIEVLPMGVDLAGRFVVEDGQHRDCESLLFVGRLVPKKGLNYLLDAMPAILARRPQATLDIVGFGPEQEALEARAHARGIARSVRFVGPMAQRELPAFYRRASVFVAPFIRDASGDQDGLPVALMEAIGCGCPVVVGDVAGVRDLLGDSAGDAIVDPRDSGKLADAVVRTLEDPVASAAQAAEFRTIAAERVDWERVADRYSAVIAAAGATRSGR